MIMVGASCWMIEIKEILTVRLRLMQKYSYPKKRMFSEKSINSLRVEGEKFSRLPSASTIFFLLNNSGLVPFIARIRPWSSLFFHHCERWPCNYTCFQRTSRDDQDYLISKIARLLRSTKHNADEWNWKPFSTLVRNTLFSLKLPFQRPLLLPIVFMLCISTFIYIYM